MPDDRREQPHELFDAFAAAMRERAEKRAPSTPLGAAARFGWGTAEIADAFGVSRRTARRWRQHNSVPARRRSEWKAVTSAETEARMRKRLERRGLKGLSATGKYRVSNNPKYEYKSNPWAPVRLRGTNRITGATMRAVFDAADAGDLGAAEEALSDALAEGYEMDGDMGIAWVEVDGLDFDIN